MGIDEFVVLYVFLMLLLLIVAATGSITAVLFYCSTSIAVYTFWRQCNPD